MATLPVIPDTYRITLNWESYFGVTPRNVFHVHAASTSGGELADSLQGSFNSEMFGCLMSGQVLTTITVLELDGISAGVERPLDAVVDGSQTGDSSPASAGIFKMSTAVRGAQGRGRLFLGPCGEGAISNGRLDDGVVASMQGGWETFAASIAAQSVPCNLVVASYAHATSAEVINATVEHVLGTQRRRQQQLRRV